MKQLSLFQEKSPREFGGDLLTGRRKSKRHLNTHLPIHLVLRADVTASGSLLRWERLVKKLIKNGAKTFHVVIHEQAIVGNHIHLLIHVALREHYNNFVRALTGSLAQKTKLKWQTRPYTRIVQKGLDQKNVKKYIIQNQLEDWGIIAHQPRQR